MFNCIFKLIYFASVSHACATCGFNDNSTQYFLGMILFMTLLPVLLVGGTVLYIRKKGAQIDSHEK